MLVSLLSVLGSLNFRVQICAPTNTAVREVAMRFMKHMVSIDYFSGEGSEQFGASRPAAQLEVVDGKSPVSVLHLGDVLLVGNPQRIESVEGMEEFDNMVLANRAKNLQGAFDSVVGYKPLAIRFAEFLQHPMETYHKRLNLIRENEKIRKSESGKSKNESGLSKNDHKSVCNKDEEQTKLPTVAEFVRSMMRGVAEPLTEKSRIISTDVPSALIQPTTRQQLYVVSKLVEKMIGMVDEANDRVLELWVQMWTRSKSSSDTAGDGSAGVSSVTGT